MALSRSRRPRRPNLSVEPLEARSLLDAGLSHGVLTVVGTPGDDVLAVEIDDRFPTLVPQLRVVLNGDVVYENALFTVHSLRVDGGAGNDTIRIAETLGSLPAAVRGGDGNDVLAAGAGRTALYGDSGNDSLYGGAGADLLVGGTGADVLDGGRGQNLLDGPGDTVQNGTPLTGSASYTAEQLETYLIDQGVAVYGSQFGQPYFAPPIAYGPGVADGTLTNASGNHSNTNTQTQGVDEGDLVENDGRYLYLISGSELVILNAGQSGAPAVVSRTALSERPSALYLDGERLTVLATEYDTDFRVALLPPGVPFAPQPPRVRLTVYDVSDRTAPQVTKSALVDGNLLDSRAANGHVYLVLGGEIGDLTPRVAPGGTTFESEAEYRARLAGQVLDGLPGYYTDLGSDTSPTRAGGLSDPSAIRGPGLVDGLGLVTVVALDTATADEAPDGSLGLLGQGWAQLYASGDHLYLFTTTNSLDGRTWGEDSWTEVRQIRFNGDQLSLEASGVVAGRVNDRFALDESDGALRVVTADRWGEGAVNSLYVLQREGDRLLTVGEVENFDPGESLRAVRFADDRGYAVTFLQTDPVFVFDLADPANPAITGELRIPGFSSYLQPLDANHLFGIGRDADEDGRVRGLQVSLYDVSDPANPQLADRELIAAEGWAYSLAEYDPHAFLFDAAAGVLAIPVESTGPDGRGAASSLYVFEVTSDDLRPSGTVRHDTAVQRSTRIDDRLYSLALDEVSAVALHDPGTVLGTTTIRTSEAVVTGATFGAFSGDPSEHVIATFTAPDQPILFGGGDVNPAALSILPGGYYYSASVDWGDGEFGYAYARAQGDGRFEVVGGHIYQGPGSYNVTVTVYDRYGIPATAASTAEVVQGDEFVGRVYQDLLGRVPDAAGNQFWVASLSGGVGREVLVQAVVGSAEYRTGQVDQLYQATLGRVADEAGRAAAVQYLLHGGTTQVLHAALLGSEEYLLRSGGDAADFLSALYTQTLGRDVDVGGAAFWIDVMHRGGSRHQIAALVLGTEEAQHAAVEAARQELTGGAAANTARPAALAAPDAVVAQVVASDAYFSRIRQFVM